MRPADIPARIAHARELYRRCVACEWRCGVDRVAGELGRCGLDAQGRVARESLSVGEEADLSPSHLVYFSGCSFRCAFCLSGEMVVHPRKPAPTSLRVLTDAVMQRQQEGARTLNVLGGDPSVNVLAILELVAALPPNVKLVWNTNLYHSDEVAELLDGVVDVWLADLKFGQDACARRLAQVERYTEVVHRNLRRVRAGGQRLMVRHLLMPGHLECCTEPVALFLARELPDVEVSLMGTFLPLHRTPDCAELLADPTWDGAEQARRIAAKHGLRTVTPSALDGVTTRTRGYAGTLFFDANGNVTMMDPSADVMALARALSH
ncbi:MAG: radical SAM protein [Myxococcota bacterium]